MKRLLCFALVIGSLVTAAHASSTKERAMSIDVVKRYFSCLQSGDIPGLLDLLDEDIIWHQPGQSTLAGRHEGKKAVIGLFQSFLAISENSFRIDEVSSIMANDDMVSATLKFSAQRPGLSISMKGVDIMKIKGGKIVEVWLFSENQAAEDEFWGR